MARAISLPLLLVAILFVSSISSGVSEAQNLDPSCIAQAKKAGPCVNKPYGPKYNAKCTTNTKDGPLKYEGYLGAPCKENDGTAFTVPGKCVPGNKCFCEKCLAEGDKEMPMMPMLPMPMMMPGMEMPSDPCSAAQQMPRSASSTGSFSGDCNASGYSGILDSLGDTGSGGSGLYGLLDDFSDWGDEGTSGILQNAAFGALNALGGIANTVSGSVIDTAANAISNLTGLPRPRVVNTPIEQDPEIILDPWPYDVSGAGGGGGPYAQAAYVHDDPRRVVPRPRYAYDDDTSQYGVFSGQGGEQTLLQAVLSAISRVLTQISASIGTLFGIL